MSINLEALKTKVDSIKLHSNIREQLGLLVEEVISVEINIYKKKAFLKVVSQEVANRAVTKCQGTLRYIEENLVHELPVEEVNENVLPVHISNLPFEISNQQLTDVFSKYGKVIKVVSNTYSEAHIYHKAYSGKRTLYLQSSTSELPAFLDLFGHRVQVYHPLQVKKCFRCLSLDHLISECDQPPPPHRENRGGFPVNSPSAQLLQPNLEKPLFSYQEFPHASAWNKRVPRGPLVTEPQVEEQVRNGALSGEKENGNLQISREDTRQPESTPSENTGDSSVEQMQVSDPIRQECSQSTKTDLQVNSTDSEVAKDSFSDPASKTISGGDLVAKTIGTVQSDTGQVLSVSERKGEYAQPEQEGASQEVSPSFPQKGEETLVTPGRSKTSGGGSGHNKPNKRGATSAQTSQSKRFQLNQNKSGDIVVHEIASEKKNRRSSRTSPSV